MPPKSVGDVILDAIRPPEKDWSSTLGIFAVLFGSGAALLESRTTIEHMQPGPATWSRLDLFPEFEKHYKATGAVAWRFSLNMALWSLGFFLNKAQQNLASALDRCVNLWICALMPEAGLGREAGQDLLGSWISARLATLSALLTRVGATTDQIQALREAFREYGDTRTVAHNLKEISSGLAHEFPWVRDKEPKMNLDDLYSLMQNYSDAQGAAIVFSRVNAFKHQPAGALDRFSVIYPVEWILTTKGLEFTGRLWKHMVDHSAEKGYSLEERALAMPP